MTKTQSKAARSTQTPGAPNKNPSGLPYGTGSIQVRGNVWWMIFRDAEGRVVQENTRTEDQDAARKMLAARALETLHAKVAVLEAIIEGKNPGSGAGTGSRKGRTGSGAPANKSGRKAEKGSGR